MKVPVNNSTKRHMKSNQIKPRSKKKLHSNFPVLFNKSCQSQLFTDPEVFLTNKIVAAKIKKQKSKNGDNFKKPKTVWKVSMKENKENSAKLVLSDVEEEVTHDFVITDEDDIEIFRDVSTLPSLTKPENYHKFVKRFNKINIKKDLSPRPTSRCSADNKRKIVELSDLESDIFDETDSSDTEFVTGCASVNTEKTSTTETGICYNSSASNLKTIPVVPISVKYPHLRPLLNSTANIHDNCENLEFTQDLSPIHLRHDNRNEHQRRQTSEETTPVRPNISKQKKLRKAPLQRKHKNKPPSSTNLFHTPTSYSIDTLPDFSSIHSHDTVIAVNELTSSIKTNSVDKKNNQHENIKPIKPTSPLNLRRFLADETLVNKQSTFKVSDKTLPIADFGISSISEPVYDSDDLIPGRRPSHEINSDEFYHSFEFESVEEPAVIVPQINNVDDFAINKHRNNEQINDENSDISVIKETFIERGCENKINSTQFSERIRAAVTSSYNTTSSWIRQKKEMGDSMISRKATRKSVNKLIPTCSLMNQNKFQPSIPTLIQQKTLQTGKIFWKQVNSAPPDVLCMPLAPPKGLSRGIQKNKYRFYFKDLKNDIKV